MGSPTQRSIKHLKDLGYEVAIVERYLPTRPRPTKVDLFGCFDLVAIPREGEPHIVFVQTTTASNMSARVKKIQASPVLPYLKRIELLHMVVHGWRAPTVTRRTWSLREVEL